MADFNRLTRRALLKQATAGALIVAFCVDARGRVGAAPDSVPMPPASPLLPEPNAFLRISRDNRVTVLLAHSEMGQGIGTTLAMLVAEELDCDLAAVAIEHAPTAPVYRHTVFGAQSTGGSATTMSEFLRYRQVGALARTMLMVAAARTWGVSVSACDTELGHVVCDSRRIPYGTLAAEAAKLSTPKRVVLKDRSRFRLLGHSQRRLDAPGKVDGRAKFGLDIQLPGLLTALVARPPVFGARVKAFDAGAAKRMPGVVAVVPVRSGVAVVAEGFYAARRGRDALTIEWEPGPGKVFSTERMAAELHRLVTQPGVVVREQGRLVTSRGARLQHEAVYEFPYLAHAVMEPLNCTVRLNGDRCEIWTGTQMQAVSQAAAAEELGMATSQVDLHTPYIGGGFGRRAAPDAHFVREAVQIAKAVGRPVKTVWTREDDIRGGYYRPAYVHAIKAALSANGMPVSWHHRIAGQSVAAGTILEPALSREGYDRTSVEGAADSPYLANLESCKVELHSPTSAVPVQAWRSVGHSHTAFVVETFVDELAQIAGQDPLAYRRRLLAGNARCLRVLDHAARAAQWGGPLPAGRARGMAVHESYGSCVAQIAEVSIEAGAVRVHRVTCAIDCGFAVNPDGVRAQMESGIAFGLGAALYGEITIRDGAVRQSNFHDYRVLRINEMPQVDVHIVESDLPMGGAGEPAVPVIAPAVANALAALTGRRIRRLPITATD